MSLSVGDVFWFVNPEIKSPKSHLHIVVGITIDRKIHYVYATSEKRFMEFLCKRAEGKKDCSHLNTLVETDSTECSELDHTSYINANLNFNKNEYSLTRMCTFDYCEEVKASNALMGKLTAALLSSKTSPEILKNMLRAGLIVNNPNPPVVSQNPR